MTILVTGGAGFIGSHLCERLLCEGNRVICLDNLCTSSRANIQHLLDQDNFVFVEHDIIEPYFFQETIDQIYNLACPASPVQYQVNPVRTIKTNTIGTINVLGIARKHRARLLQASTSEVYGDPLIHPQTEEYRGNVNTIGPRACYDEGKRCAETLCFDYMRMHAMDVRVVRIFNTYGPRMAIDDGRVVSNFIVNAIRSLPLQVDGNGSQTRSFCYVDDLVDGLILMMNSETVGTGPVNLGNPIEFTIKELADQVLALTGSMSGVTYAEAFREDDPMKRKPDITKAQTKLGWHPAVPLDIGLQKTIAYFRQQLSV